MNTRSIIDIQRFPTRDDPLSLDFSIETGHHHESRDFKRIHDEVTKRFPSRYGYRVSVTAVTQTSV